MPRQRHFKTSMTIVMVLAVVFLTATLAGAYCVYNHTNHKLKVCGGNCAHCMKKAVEPGDKACCPRW